MKKVLLIANRGYSKNIISKLEEKGYEVDYYNDKPNDGFVCKMMGRYRIAPYKLVLTKYYCQILEKTKNKTYDYLLMIRGEYATEKALEIYRKEFVHTKKILYMWDSVRNNKGVQNKWQYFDVVFTFDRNDYLKYEKQIKFLPLFYIDTYKNLAGVNKAPKYDYAFIGTAHGDRPRILKQLSSQFKERGNKYYIYMYSPHFLVFCANKLFNTNYKGIKKRDLNFTTMSFDDTANIYANSICAIDVESKTQTGLTMRTIELLGMKKKIITTNRDIVNYDFYEKNNIYVFDRKDVKLDENFLKLPYKELPEEIYKKYSLSSWIDTVLGG